MYYVYVSWFSTKSASLSPMERSGIWNVPVLHPTLSHELLQFTGQPVWGGGALPAPSRAPTPPHSSAGWVCLTGLKSASKIQILPCRSCTAYCSCVPACILSCMFWNAILPSGPSGVGLNELRRRLIEINPKVYQGAVPREFHCTNMTLCDITVHM